MPTLREITYTIIILLKYLGRLNIQPYLIHQPLIAACEQILQKLKCALNFTSYYLKVFRLLAIKADSVMWSIICKTRQLNY